MTSCIPTGQPIKEFDELPTSQSKDYLLCERCNCHHPELSSVLCKCCVGEMSDQSIEKRLKTVVVERKHIYPFVELHLDGKKITEQTGMESANCIIEDYLVQYGLWGFKVMQLKSENNMDFETKLREVLDGVNPLVNWSITIPAIKQLIRESKPEKRTDFELTSKQRKLKDDSWGSQSPNLHAYGYNAGIEAWSERLGL